MPDENKKVLNLIKNLSCKGGYCKPINKLIVQLEISTTISGRI
jgi:hypothetical protein